MRQTSIRRQLTRQARRGQALVEYALILALIALAFGFALAATGPVIGNVFSNTVYNLIGQTPEMRELPGPADFWLTVTWVHENPLEERLLPTRTLAPPSATPTDGPSPTPTPITPTNTPLPTSTPRPTNTPEDFAYDAPHLDTVDSPRHWRVDETQFLGTADWKGYYFEGMNLDYEGAEPTHPEGLWNRTVYGSAAYGVLDFPNSQFLAWTNPDSGPLANWPEADSYQEFSIRFVREIYLPGPDPVTLNFHLRSDDGSRMWLLAPGQSTATCSNVPREANAGDDGGRILSGSRQSSNSNRSFGDDSAYSDDCLMIDAWTNQSPTTTSVTRTIAPGHYRLQVDYYENSGGAELRLDINVPSNPDDSRVAGTGGVECNWGQIAREMDANSLDTMWKEYVGDEPFKLDMRCHLEFRGFVYIPVAGDTAEDGSALEPMERPELVFWDVWDMPSPLHTTWLEIAEYIPEPGTERALDRDQLDWIRVDLHEGVPINYNWTRNVVDLTNVNGVDFRGKRVTFRFVMEAANGDDWQTRTWYIDDIEVREGNVNNFLPGTSWNLNTPDQRDDFIASGHWDLTANNAAPDPDNPGESIDCCSWELMPDDRVYNFTESLWDDEPTSLRVHYVEIDGWVDFSGGIPDDEGHTGWPLLTFYHAYDVREQVGLEVQYTLDPPGVGPSNWQVVPGDPGDLTPAGQIRTISEIASDRLMQPIDVTLRNIPAERFRLRFAVLAHRGAGESSAGEGWWIDNIYLHREDPPNFLDYPFYDDAEAGMVNWTVIGTWGRTNAMARVGDHSFTDSPGGTYGNNQSLRMEFSDPIDLCNNTEANLDLTDRNAAGGNGGGAAIDPVLTFWHKRDLAITDHFYVDWRRYDEPGNWQPLWAYRHAMNTDPNDSNSRSANQLAWEFVEIDLAPIYDSGACSTDTPEIDDIMLRLRVETDNSTVADGVYIDDIRIDERQQTFYRLWPSSAERDLGDGQAAYGDGATFTANLEESDWAERWRASGNWTPVAWEQRTGLLSWHESTLGQESAPDGYDDWWNDPDSGITRTLTDAFQVLEIAPIIDLRGTLASENPTLTFWTRYHTGEKDRIRVEISEMLTADSRAEDLDMDERCDGFGLSQCYEQNYGWSQWRTIGFDVDGWKANYAWHRQQISLTNYIGKQIRIRFVHNSLDTNDNAARDGWYIDDVSIGPRNPRVLKVISEGAFYDPARNMVNWVGEGDWGLSPELYRGDGGGPTTLGVWQERLWLLDSTERNRLNSLHGLNLSSNMRDRASQFLYLSEDIQDDVVHKAYREVLNINYVRSSGEAIRPGTLDYDEYIAGEWVMDVGPIGLGIQPGEYTFITIGDDGMRLRYEEIDAAGNPVDPPDDDAPESEIWNMVWDWRNRGATTDMSVATLEQGKRYRFTLQWFENTGNMRAVLTTGGTSFSFTDTPKQGAGPAFPDIPPIARSNSALISNGVFDLSDTTEPVLEYYTYYHASNGLKVQVSRDGGFTWTQDGLNHSRPLPWGGNVSYDGPNLSWTTYLPSATRDWRRRRHTLYKFAGEQIMVRFLMQHDTNLNMNSGYYRGWWVTDITIGE